MAVAETNANARASGGVTHPSSAKADRVIAHLNATATAQTATELLAPQTITSANVRVIAVGDAVTRVLIRPRIATTTTAVATSPVVRIIGIVATADDDAWTDGVPVRLDNVDNTAAGLTLTLEASPSGSNSLTSGSYRYGDTKSLTATDLLGVKWLVIPVETAASITGGTCDIEVLLLN